jgi:hypothetical protein
MLRKKEGHERSEADGESAVLAACSRLEASLLPAVRTDSTTKPKKPARELSRASTASSLIYRCAYRRPAHVLKVHEGIMKS